ncbi:hypothetical protein GCWU000282_01063 [Catonella morbi ATCC 51271]|uniref:Uncharacterized protein n=1 Tax=Catonella morbi ATCC 51271 TaxID=592026 RepID=V2ZAD2_9FIRM|nr:transposase [Catonella morbi]ESL03895.1 hypothetical protein GCWU000282_01063 [Catonella morbi ATCC 51271]
MYDLGEISEETIFIDGTKIGANANKYTLVWKKSVTKNQAKLLIKLAVFVAECEKLYEIEIVHGERNNKANFSTKSLASLEEILVY